MIRKLTRTAPIPTGAKITTRNGDRVAVWTEPRPGGLSPTRRTAPLTKRRVGNHPPGTRIVVESKRWYSSFTDHTGARRTLAAYTDRAASEELDRKLRTLAACRESGTELDEELRIWIDQTPAPLRKKLRSMDLLDRRAEEIAQPLTKHVATYHAALVDRDDTPGHADLVKARLEQLFAGCGVRYWRDLDAEKVAAWLADKRRADEHRTRTSGHFVRHVRAFCRWMVETGRAPSSPLRSLKAVAVTDEQERGVFGVEQLQQLFAYLDPDPAEQPPPVRVRMDGATRALLYRLAVETGLRLGALRSLTGATFRFSEDGAAVVTVEAGQQKNRRRHRVPIRPCLALELRRLIARTPGGQPLFNAPRNMARVLQDDLEAAGLPTQDSEGRPLVFHSLRHTCGTWMNELGVDDAVVQLILGHQTRALTTDRYQHARIERAAEAMTRLPDLVALRSTGTDAGDNRATQPPAAATVGVEVTSEASGDATADAGFTGSRSDGGALRTESVGAPALPRSGALAVRQGGPESARKSHAASGKKGGRTGNLGPKSAPGTDPRTSVRDSENTLQKQSFDAEYNTSGQVAERLNAPVSKTGMPFGVSWVRIPPCPLCR